MTKSNLILLYLLISSIAFSQRISLKDNILFYCSFDNGTRADHSIGDPMIYTAENYEKTDIAKPGLHSPDVVIAKNKGLTGHALHFQNQIKAAVYFSGDKNLGYNSKSWNGSFSFWLQVDPAKELAPGYCDPINLTDKRFDDAALWVDFTDVNPRAFRLGVMGDLEYRKRENKNTKEEFEKRLVTVKQPFFNTGKWTHVVITYSKINTNESVCKLFLDGEYMGDVKGINDPFTWKEENAKIMLGLGYIGMIDEITVFNKSLDHEEVRSIYELKDGIKELFK